MYCSQNGIKSQRNKNFRGDNSVTWGFARHEPPTRRRHALQTPQVAQNPHCSPVDEQECEESGLRCPTMWIGCDDLDRLITYPEASFLPRRGVPTQKRRSYPEEAFLPRTRITVGINHEKLLGTVSVPTLSIRDSAPPRSTTCSHRLATHAPNKPIGSNSPRASIWLLHHHVAGAHWRSPQSDLERRYE